MATTRSPLAYAVTTRYGEVCVTSRREAMRRARDEARDGWPTRVRDMRTGEVIYRG